MVLKGQKGRNPLGNMFLGTLSGEPFDYCREPALAGSGRSQREVRRAAKHGFDGPWRGRAAITTALLSSRNDQQAEAPEMRGPPGDRLQGRAVHGGRAGARRDGVDHRARWLEGIVALPTDLQHTGIRTTLVSSPPATRPSARTRSARDARTCSPRAQHLGEKRKQSRRPHRGDQRRSER